MGSECSGGTRRFLTSSSHSSVNEPKRCWTKCCELVWTRARTKKKKKKKDFHKIHTTNATCETNATNWRTRRNQTDEPGRFENASRRRPALRRSLRVFPTAAATADDRQRSNLPPVHSTRHVQVTAAVRPVLRIVARRVRVLTWVAHVRTRIDAERERERKDFFSLPLPRCTDGTRYRAYRARAGVRSLLYNTRVVRRKPVCRRPVRRLTTRARLPRTSRPSTSPSNHHPPRLPRSGGLHAIFLFELQ